METLSWPKKSILKRILTLETPPKNGFLTEILQYDGAHFLIC